MESEELSVQLTNQVRTVVTHNYGRVLLLEVVPKRAVIDPGTGRKYFRMPGENSVRLVSPIWLSARGRDRVERCLGDDVDAYLTPATIHGKWKRVWRQGIVYALKWVDITHFASWKPAPSSEEREKLTEKVIDMIRNGMDLYEILTVLSKECLW